MTLRTRAATEVGGDYAAVSDDGTIYWTTWDPFSSQVAATTLWRQLVGDPPQSVGVVSDGRYLWLSWADGSLVAVERRASPEATRLVRLAAADPGADPVPLTDWQERAGDMWIERNGDWTTWIEPNVPSDEPDQIVVRHEGREFRMTLPGYGGRVPTLTPDHQMAIYQRSETARLTVVGVPSGTILGGLDAHEFYGGEILRRRGSSLRQRRTVRGRPTTYACWTSGREASPSWRNPRRAPRPPRPCRPSGSQRARH